MSNENLVYMLYDKKNDKKKGWGDFDVYLHHITRILEQQYCTIFRHHDTLPYLSLNLCRSISLPLDMFQICWIHVQQCRPWLNAAFSSVKFESTLFAQARLSTYFGQII